MSGTQVNGLDRMISPKQELKAGESFLWVYQCV